MKIISIFLRLISKLAIITPLLNILIKLIPKKKPMKFYELPSSYVNTSMICPDCKTEIKYDKLLDKFFCEGCKKIFEIALIEIGDINGECH